MNQANTELATHPYSFSAAPLKALLAETGVAQHFAGEASLHGDPNLIRSRHRLVEASGTALLLVGSALAAIWEKLTGEANDVAVGFESDWGHCIRPGERLYRSLGRVR